MRWPELELVRWQSCHHLLAQALTYEEEQERVEFDDPEASILVAGSLSNIEEVSRTIVAPSTRARCTLQSEGGV